ncbi:MAG: sigma-70 family RNA polymerase sigma factor [Planctomycetota bacterium]|nr:sigma-70 family RNA polymerase sigma factor [Planctomycetota bacterium]
MGMMARTMSSAAGSPASSTATGRSLERLGDGDLLRGYLDPGPGREEAFAELVRRHGALVHGACRRRVRDAAQAEDAAQAVFVLLARKAGSLAARASLAGWLYQASEWVTRTMQRDARIRRRHERAAASREASPAEEAGGLREVLDEALGALKPRDREALVLHYLEGLPQQQAAARLGLRHDAYRQRLGRALERMKTHLAASGRVYAGSALGAALLEVARADGRRGYGPRGPRPRR